MATLRRHLDRYGSRIKAEKFMSIFIFSLLAGLALHQMVSIIQPTRITSKHPVGKRFVKLGRRTVITFDDNAYLTAKLWLLAVAFMAFFSFGVILIAQFAHPAVGFPYRFADALTSSRMAAVVFGGLVGILLGNFLNRILRAEDDYKFTSADRLQLALIFALAVLGIGGEEVLRSSAQRINKISVGTTTEISFSDGTPKSSRVSAEQPSGAYQNTQGKSGGSAGLGKLYDIGSVGDLPHIERDRELIEVLARYEREPVPKPVDVGRMSFDVLSPLASCLSRISRLYGDDAYVEAQLTPVAVALRELVTGTPTGNRQIRDSLTQAFTSAREYEKNRKEEFKAMASELKPKLDERSSCERLTALNFEPALTDDSINKFRASHALLPYVAMTYASVMAELHHYESAAITMDAWIRSRMSPKTAAEKWLLLRAQITQVFFVDEWLRERGSAASSPLRKYHIDNLKNIMEEMRSLSAIAQISRKNDGYKWSYGLFGVTSSGDDGDCEIAELPEPVAGDVAANAPPAEKQPQALSKTDAISRLKVIYNSYLSARKDYVDHSLKHPIEKVKSAAVIDNEIAALMQLSLKCISFGPDGQRRTRAEHIERYVRSELNMLENTAPLKSGDEIGDKVREARQLLAQASQLIEPQVIDAKRRFEGGPIQNRLATDPVLELYETLLATQSQLQSFSQRELLK